MRDDVKEALGAAIEDISRTLRPLINAIEYQSEGDTDSDSRQAVNRIYSALDHLGRSVPSP